MPEICQKYAGNKQIYAKKNAGIANSMQEICNKS